MQEAFIKLFSGGDSAQTFALIILLGVSFLLGMLVWALLAHFPAVFKLRQANKELTDENNYLKKENKDLSERYTVINAKLTRTTEDLETAEANLKEKNEKFAQQKEKLTQVSAQLDLYRDNARNYKEANEKLMDEYKKTAELYDRAKEQVDGMKGIVEEVENDKRAVSEKNGELMLYSKDLEYKIATLTSNLNKSNESIELLKKDLDAALAQRAELKKMLADLEAVGQMSNTDDSDLKTQIVGLKSHIRELEQENNDLMEKLAPHLAKEQTERRNNEEMDRVMAEWLAEAEENMQRSSFYMNYDEDLLIEDKKYLERNLLDLKHQEPVAKTARELLLSDEEEESMTSAMRSVETAMKLQGFYGDVEESFFKHNNENDHLSDDELIDKHLESAAKVVNTAFFFNEEAQGGFEEHPELLATELAKIDFLKSIPEIEKQRVALSEPDHEELEAALELARHAVNAEGLYAPIDAEKLMGIDEPQSDVDKSYLSELEQAIVKEIGKNIPKASPEQKDDLQKIDGIGSFVEQRLNHLGIYTYQQISQFDEAFMAKLGKVLGFSEQTIARDKWVEQAKLMMNY